MGVKVVAITGSYRRGETIDAAVEAVLAGARARGAETAVIRLAEQHLEFCTNCRACAQEPGPRRGACPQQDDLEAILGRVEAADAIVLATPVNFYNATALFRRFLERLLGFVHWPWGQAGPVLRDRRRPRKAILVSSLAAPALFLPFATGAARALKVAARILGARPVGRLWLGLSAKAPHQVLSPRALARARALGERLV